MARKAGAAIRSNREGVTREWLKALIGDLSLVSLESFPTRELTANIPGLIEFLASELESLPTADLKKEDLGSLASCIAGLRKEDASLDKLLGDYTVLKKLILEAASCGLRRSDQAVIALAGLIDEGFDKLLRAGMKAYVERHSYDLQQLADTDPLTGIYNVRFFRRQLHRQLELYKRYRIPFSLLMLDLDELKQLNDARGHKAGDQALRNLARIMEEEKRETDIAVRYGGDEFFLLLPGTPTEDGERLAYRISRRVKELNLNTDGAAITGVSIGVVSCPENGTDISSLRTKADRAMYLAKTLGGGTVARYRDFYESQPV